MKKVLIIGDFGKDLDDEISLLIASTFKEEIKLIGVIANLYPSNLRANIAKSTLDELLMFDVPVAVGENITEKIGVNDYESEIPYLKEHNINLNGYELLYDKLMNSNGVHIVLQSGLTDFAKFYKENPNLVYNKVDSITIMGGVQINENNQPLLNDSGFIIPDTAANNNFDLDAAEWLYRQIQIDEIVLNISTRNMAYAAQLSNKFYDEIEYTPIGKSLKTRQKKSLVQLYKDTFITGEKRTLPERCTTEWFLNTFSSLTEYNGNPDDIFQYCSKITIYDPLNLMILVDNFKENYLNPVTINNVNIYGLSSEENGFQKEKSEKAIRYLSTKVVGDLFVTENYKKLSLFEKINFDIDTAQNDVEKSLIKNCIFKLLFKDLEKKSNYKETMRNMLKVYQEKVKEKTSLDNREKAAELKFVVNKLNFYLNF